MTGSREAEALDRRRIRAARNQAMFREVNERIGELAQRWSSEMGFICECLDTACSEAVSLSVAEYECIRKDPGSFVVAPGHEVRDVEDVVSTNERYTVVRKSGVGYEAAAELDPRRASSEPA